MFTLWPLLILNHARVNREHVIFSIFEKSIKGDNPDKKLQSPRTVGDCVNS